MSISNIGGGKDPFIPPEESDEKGIENQEERASFSGHDIDVQDKNVKDKTSKLKLSLPDLSEKIQENPQRRRASSDSALEQEHIYDVPRSFFQEESIYDVPKGVGRQEEISDISKSSQERNQGISQSTEQKIGQAAGVLSSDQEHIYDVPSKPGESGFALAEEPIYENIDVLLGQLGLLSDFDQEQQQVVNEFIERVNLSAAECMNTCETLLEDSTRTQRNERVRSKLLKVVSDVEETGKKIADQLNRLGIEFAEGWKAQFSVKTPSPTKIYYKQTTSSLLRERFKVSSDSFSPQSKQKLQEVAKRQNLDVQFLVSGKETLIIMTSPEKQTPFQKVQEKLDNLLSSFRSLYQTKVTSQSQPKNLDVISEVFLSLLKLLTNFSQRVTDLSLQQKHFLEGVLSQQSRRGSYSFEKENPLSGSREERYKKIGEEDTRL